MIMQWNQKVYTCCLIFDAMITVKSSIKQVVELEKMSKDKFVDDAPKFLEEIAEEQYLYMGRNNLPHRIIYNGVFSIKTNCFVKITVVKFLGQAV